MCIVDKTRWVVSPMPLLEEEQVPQEVPWLIFIKTLGPFASCLVISVCSGGRPFQTTARETTSKRRQRGRKTICFDNVGFILLCVFCTHYTHQERLGHPRRGPCNFSCINQFLLTQNAGEIKMQIRMAITLVLNNGTHPLRSRLLLLSKLISPNVHHWRCSEILATESDC